MNWLTKFLTSSIGQKLIMSLTGLFLIIFLVVHLAGNFQLLLDDGGEKFNLYAEFMTSNPLIKTVSYGLYAFIILHAIQGILLWRKNKAAVGGSRYAVKAASGTTWASRNMGPLGMIILVFILLHMYQFWLQMKMGNVGQVSYGEKEVYNLYEIVALTFRNPVYVIVYVVSMLVIAFHLAHGFQSAFQTLGLNHKKYTPLIKGLGLLYSILIPLAFAIIPVYFLLSNK